MGTEILDTGDTVQSSDGFDQVAPGPDQLEACWTSVAQAASKPVLMLTAA